MIDTAVTIYVTRHVIQEALPILKEKTQVRRSPAAEQRRLLNNNSYTLRLIHKLMIIDLYNRSKCDFIEVVTVSIKTRRV